MRWLRKWQWPLWILLAIGLCQIVAFALPLAGEPWSLRVCFGGALFIWGGPMMVLWLTWSVDAEERTWKEDNRSIQTSPAWRVRRGLPLEE